MPTVASGIPTMIVEKEIVTVGTVTFLFVEMDNIDVFKVPRDCLFIPDGVEQNG